MTTISHEPTRGHAERPSLWSQLRIPEMWASLAIIAMWVSVMFAAVYGANVQTSDAGGSTSTIPSAVFLGLFAFFATWIVARYGFRHDRTE
ncbi:MAG TPA: hypothetical protein VK874_09965 [Gaiellaceae bacterium]|nr:hypothetical protein [Gaiellaceae bacterium]